MKMAMKNKLTREENLTVCCALVKSLRENLAFRNRFSSQPKIRDDVRSEIRRIIASLRKMRVALCYRRDSL